MCWKLRMSKIRWQLCALTKWSYVIMHLDDLRFKINTRFCLNAQTYCKLILAYKVHKIGSLEKVATWPYFSHVRDVTTSSHWNSWETASPSYHFCFLVNTKLHTPHAYVLKGCCHQTLYIIRISSLYPISLIPSFFKRASVGACHGYSFFAILCNRFKHMPWSSWYFFIVILHFTPVIVVIVIFQSHNGVNQVIPISVWFIKYPHICVYVIPIDVFDMVQSAKRWCGVVRMSNFKRANHPAA